MILDVQEYLQEWEKTNNSFYPREMHWDRLEINKFLKDYKHQLTTTEVISGSFTDSDIGKEFEIVGNSNDHGFEMGEVVTLSEKNKIDKGDERRFDSKEDYWWCIPEDVRKL